MADANPCPRTTMTHPISRISRRLLAGAVLLSTAAVPAAAQGAAAAPRYDVRAPLRPHPGFVVASADVDAEGRMPAAAEANGFGCAGENRSPAVSWRGAPAGTKSFAVTLYDLDAPTGSGFWHWLVLDVPASATALPAGAGGAPGGPPSPSLPAGARQVAGDAGAPGFAGLCPPPGDGPHRYVLTVHALGTERLEVPQGASAAVVGFVLGMNTLATATLQATYERPASPPAGGSPR